MTLSWIIIFAIMYSVLFLMLDKALYRGKDTVFQNLKWEKKCDYVGRIVSIIHAVLVTITSSYACFFMW
jgi:hypothetical protein